MAKKKKRKGKRSPHHRRRQALPFNFLSGFIFAGAIIVAIALGALFYKGIKAAREELETDMADGPDAKHLPPGAKVYTRKKHEDAPPAKPKPPAQPPKTPAAPKEPEKLDLTPEAKPDAAKTPDRREAAEPPTGSPVPHLLRRIPWEPMTVHLPQAQTVTLVPTADTTVFIEPNHLRTRNGGAHDELIIKGNESLILARYDTAPIRGWTVLKAVWHGKVKRGHVRELGFGTITADWNEGTGTFKQGATGGATYSWADHGKKRWGTEDATALHVMRGNGQSLFSVGMPDIRESQSNEWIAVEFDPALVQALAAGAAEGLSISDEKGAVSMAPAAFFSRETSESHYLEVVGQLVDIEPPGRIMHLKCHPHPDLQRHSSVGVILSWTATGDDGDKGQAFQYEIRYSSTASTFERATPLPRARTPYPQPAGQYDQAVIEGLDPDTPYTFFVRAVDEGGQPGPVSEIRYTTGPRLALPSTPAPTTFDMKPLVLLQRTVGLRIYDELTGVDPLSGKPFDTLAAQAKPEATSFIWDRDARTVRLRAARNERVGFIIALERLQDAMPPVRIATTSLSGLEGEIPDRNVQFSRAVYHYTQLESKGRKWVGDALIPLDGYLIVPWEKQKVPKQKVQAVHAEIHVPASAKPGQYTGKISFKPMKGSANSIYVTVDVLPVVLPLQPKFAVELVGTPLVSALYRKDVLKTEEALPIERAYHRLAYLHRCDMACIPYAPNGECPQPFSLPVAGVGLDTQIQSWDAWDERFGIYLDGSAFEGLPGGRSGSTHVILPLFENWPTSIEEGYRCADWDYRPSPSRPSIYSGPSEGISSCMDHDYWRAFRGVARQFADHFTSEGWRTPAIGHIWLSNVPTNTYKGRGVPWSLGYPRHRDDFAAQQAFAEVLAVDAEDKGPDSPVIFRVHVPDAAYLQNFGQGVFDLLAVSDEDPSHWTILRDRAGVWGETLWLQTETAALERSPLAVQATAAAFFLEGADGWSIANTVGGKADWRRGRPQSLLYCGAPLKSDEPYASLRLKALRRAQQDIDLLLMLQEKRDWNRQQLRDFVRKYVTDRPGEYASGTHDWYRLRHAVQELLTK